MFVTKKRYDREIMWLNETINRIKDDHYRTAASLARLYAHLKLYEYPLSGVEVRSKGGPEKGS